MTTGITWPESPVVRQDRGSREDAAYLVLRVAPELLIVESGGDNLAAQYSRELADDTIYVVDVAGGDKVPRKGGPGITQPDPLVINRIDLAPLVGASLEVMDRGVPAIIEAIEAARAAALAVGWAARR